MRRFLGPRLRPLGGSLLIFAILAGCVLAYSARGGGARDNLVTNLLIDVVLVVGMQVFVGNTGVISFGHVSFAALGAYATGLLSAPTLVKGTTIAHAPFGLAKVQLSPAVSVVVAVLFVAAFAAVVGLAITRLSGLGASIVTLAMLIVVNAVLVNWVSLTGGAEAFYGIPNVMTRDWALVAVLGVIVVARLFKESRLGLRVIATREDELAAASSGVHVVRSRYVAWVVSAALTGLGGALLALFLGALSPTTFYFHLNFLTLAMLILGGMPSVTGAVLGTVVVIVGSEVTRYLGDGPVVLARQLPQIFGLSQLFLGAVITFTMILRPKGIVGDLEVETLAGRLAARVRARGRRVPSEAGGTGPTAASPPAAVAPVTAAPAPAGPAPVTGGSGPGSVVLEVRGVTKAFQGLMAVEDATVTVSRGEIVGLIGPNGAGKTTLLNVISGVLPPTRGTIHLDGIDLTGLAATHVAQRGIARTFQNLRLFGELTVRQNIEVAAGVADSHRAATRRMATDDLLTEFGLVEAAERKSSTLPYGTQRAVEMARAVALAPDVLLLDEPAAGMNEVESQRLLSVIKDVRDRQGCSVVVIDHDLHFVLNLCDRIYVLDAGRVVAEGTPEEIQRDPVVIEAYLGSRVEAPVGTRSDTPASSSSVIPATLGAATIPN